MITFLLAIDAYWGDHPDLVHGRGYGLSDRTGNVLVVVCKVQRSSDGRQKRDGLVGLIVVANRQERGCGRQHRECSRVDLISGRSNGRGKRTKSGSTTSVVPVSYNCRTRIVLAVLDRKRSGVKAMIWRILMCWGRQYLVNRVNEKESKLQLWQIGVRIQEVFERNS